jgi:hypothetical protein
VQNPSVWVGSVFGTQDISGRQRERRSGSRYAVTAVGDVKQEARQRHFWLEGKRVKH